MKDEEIISYILKGRAEYFGEIIDRYQNKIWSTAYNYTHDREEARDLTQEIFIKVYNNLTSFKTAAKFSTWLYRIAVNYCIDWTRKKRLQTVTAIMGADEGETDILDTISDATYSPEDILLRQESRERIQGAIEALPEIYRTVLILFYFEDFNPGEIAEIIEAPRKTVETRLYRARQMIKARLQEVVHGGAYYEMQRV